MIKIKDEMLIKSLEKDGKLSTRKLASKVGLPISTVHRRVRKLEEEGVIKGYRAIIDYEKAGYPVSMLVFINLSEDNTKERVGNLDEILGKIRKMPETREIMDLKGNEWDLIVKARLRKLKETTALIEKIRRIRGIEEISSTIVVDEIEV
jgi:Lrp/AsnC family leucine-responsive transcriptional regulator